MYIYIFDLDNTLLPTSDIQKKIVNIPSNTPGISSTNFYNFIKKNNTLDQLIKKIPNKKYILSNATKLHVINSLERLGIINNFDEIIDRDITYTLKPNLNNYIITMNLVSSSLNINNNLISYIFFDDMISNLITAKYIGWITVYIGNKQNRHNSVDYSFNNIFDALLFFIKNKKYHI